MLTAGFSMLHVPYKGTGPGMVALMSGELQFLMAGLATVMPQSRSGKVKALAVTGATRSRVAPDVPTVAEAGVPGYEFVVWYGMMVPGGTPRAIVMKLNAEIARVLKSPATSERYAAAGLEPISNTPEAFAAQLKRGNPKVAASREGRQHTRRMTRGGKSSILNLNACAAKRRRPPACRWRSPPASPDARQRW